jgi:hypothetical protein
MYYIEYQPGLGNLAVLGRGYWLLVTWGQFAIQFNIQNVPLYNIQHRQS